MGTELILGRQVPWGKDVARNVVSRDFHCPHSTLASSTCPRRSPSSRLGRLAAATGWGAPGMGPPPGAGQRGPRETQGKQAQGAVAAGERARGTLGHTVSVPGTLSRARRASSRGSGRDRVGSGARGQAEPQKQDSGPACRDPQWVLLAPGGTRGCKGNSWAEVGVGPGPARGDGEGWAASGALRGGAEDWVPDLREGRSQDES